MNFRSWLATLFLLFGITDNAAAAGDKIVYTVAPSDTDPAIARFDSPNLVVFDRATPASANLLVFLPGTSRDPGRSPFPRLRGFLDTAADAGYRVIALQYDNGTWVQQSCARNPDPSCAGNLHEKRVFGADMTSVIDDTPAESIVNRLTKLLQYLDSQHPGEGWGGYLANGKPRWQRIAVAGHSQGASMAAFIAKREPVARVVLLSGPADFMVPGKVLAPWLSSQAATPADRWYAMYHSQERQAELLQRACEALAIPASHVRVATREPNKPPNARENADLYHLSVNGDGTTPRSEQGEPLYRADWAFILGHS